MPVLISQNKDGSHSIIGGAGGKLNHLRLHGVKDPESPEAKAQAAERADKRKAKEAEKEKAHQQRQEGLSDEQKRAETATKADLETQRLLAERRKIEMVRDRLGGVAKDREDEFSKIEATRGKAIANRLRTALHKQQLRQADEQLTKAKNALVDHTVAEHESRAIIEKALDQQPELAATARALAEAQLAEEAADDKERRAERVLNRQRQIAGQSKVGEKAAAAVQERVKAIDAEQLRETIAAAGGRDDAEGFRQQLDAVGEIQRRAMQATDDGLQLAEVAEGRRSVDDLSPGAAKALQRAVGKNTDAEAVKAAAMAEAARKLRRAEREEARASHYASLEDPDKALAYIDALTATTRGYSEAAKKLGLRESEKAPMQAAEVEQLVDLLKHDAEAKAAIKRFREATAKIEDGDYKGARDALTIRADEVDDDTVLRGIEDDVRTQLARRVRGIGDQRDPAYVTAHATGQYDALADAALSIGRQRYVDRTTADAIGSRNAALLLRYALEQEGHNAKDIGAAVEAHHIARQEKLSREALDRAESIVPTIERTVTDVGSIEGALAELDAHRVDIEDAQRAVGAAIGRMEGLATLSWAMKQRQPDTMEVGGKGVDVDSTLAWMHASGLRPGDYTVDYKNATVTVPQSSWGKLIKRESPEVVRQRDEALAIKRGERDEQGWLAPGIVSRTATSFTAPMPTRTLFRESVDFGGLDSTSMERDRLAYAHRAAARDVQRHQQAIEAAAKVPQMEAEARALAEAGQHDESAALLRRVDAARRAGATSTDAIGRAREVASGAADALARHQGQHGDTAGRTVESALRDHVASRLADGEPAAEIASDLLTPAAVAHVPAEHRDHYREAISSIFPLTDSHGNAQRIEASEQMHRAMVQQWHARRYGADTGHFHGQDLRLDHPKTHEALFRALAENPAAAAAFKAPGDLQPQDRASIRAHIEKKLRAASADSGAAKKRQQALDELGPEPEKHDTRTISMFGGPPPNNPDWVDWHKKRAEILHDHQDGGGARPSDWSGYVQLHGDRDVALAAARDDLRGDFMRAFHRHWSQAHGEALIAGKALVAGAEKHALALGDPERAAAARERMRKLQTALAERNRESSGRFGAGSFKEELARQLVTEAATEQAQAGLFGAAPATESPRDRALRELGPEPQKHDPRQATMFGSGEPTDEWKEWQQRRKEIDEEHKASPETAPKAQERERVTADAPSTDPGERISLGHTAEAQLDAIIPTFDHNLSRSGPVNLEKITGLRQDGDFIHHQRVIKQLQTTGRVGTYLQTGSGKSLVAISGFTAQHAAGAAKRGLFLFPAKVRDQFGAEVARFTKPGAYRHDTDRGRTHAERVRLLADNDLHMRTMTHEGFRDTALQMLADHAHGGDVEKAVEHFEKLGHRQRAEALRDAMQAHGIEPGYVYLDEAHKATTRSDRDQSLMHMIMQAATHPMNASSLMLGTATPHKNDEREVASLAAMLDPDRYGDAHDVVRQMGGHLPTSMESMRRELGHLTYMAGTKPDVQRSDTSNPTIGDDGEKVGSGPLALTGQHAEHVQKIAEAYDRIRQGRGTTADAKVLSPGRFAGKLDDQHDAIARAMLSSSAIHFNRDHAFRRAINRGVPASQNVKVQAMSRVLHHDKGRGRRSVVFSDSVKELHYLRDHLESQGFRVGTLTGSDDAAEFKRRAAPERGSPEFDVVLMSKAGTEGLNLQPYQVQHNYDVPDTHASHEQRSGRIYRTGQTSDVEIHNWFTEHPYESAALRRLRRKESLSEAFQSKTPLLDDADSIARMYESALGQQSTGAYDDRTPARAGAGAASGAA